LGPVELAQSGQWILLRQLDLSTLTSAWDGGPGVVRLGLDQQQE
jgi:hypothetical protein